MPRLASVTARQLAGQGAAPRILSLVHTLDNPNAYDTPNQDFFGSAVAIDGNYAIVSATREDDAGGTNSGKAYIFNVTTGTLLQTLDNPNAYDTSAGDEFGNRVAISGNYAIIGAINEDDATGTSSGKAYIFKTTDGTWTDTTLAHTLDNPTPSGAGTNDQFGCSVSISGNFAIAGARFEDGADGINQGKAYIFNVTTGALVHTLDDPNAYDTPVGDRFGNSVSISGNYAIVGAWAEKDAGGTNAGKAYIFNVTTGALVHTIDNPSPVTAFDNFGFAVAISGDRAIVGAFQDDNPANNSGTAYIYNVTTGSLIHTLDNPSPNNSTFNDQFGFDVAISGNFAIVGAAREDVGTDGSTESGVAYIFNVTTGELIHTIENPNPVGTPDIDFFGDRVAITNNYALVGCQYEDVDLTDSPGKAYIFKY